MLANLAFSPENCFNSMDIDKFIISFNGLAFYCVIIIIIIIIWDLRANVKPRFESEARVVAGGEKGWRLLISEVKCFKMAFEVRKRRSCSDRERNIVPDCRRSRTEGAFTDSSVTIQWQYLRRCFWVFHESCRLAWNAVKKDRRKYCIYR